MNLGPEEDWFARVMRGEKNEPFDYQTEYYRLANPVVQSLRCFHSPNSSPWSNGPEKIARYGTLYYDLPNKSDSFTGNTVGTTPNGVAVSGNIIWDGDHNRFVGVATQHVQGKPLNRVDAEWSRDFEPLDPKPNQLVVAGGAREYDHWYGWQTVVPDKFEALVTLTIPQRDGPPKMIEKKLRPGLQLVQLQAKPNENAPSASVELRISQDRKDDKQTFELPHSLGDRPAIHPPIVQVLNPDESKRLLSRPLKTSSEALIVEIKLQPQ